MGPRELPRILEEEHQLALLKQFNTRYRSGLKNRCMARLMLDLGLRVSEVTGLQPSHLDMTSCTLTVIAGKNSKGRVLSVSAELRDWIGKWLEVRPESDWLFPSRHGLRLARQSLHQTIRHYAEKAGIPNAEQVGPHTLRHTFATRLYRETKDIRLVQKALGHAQLSTTMIYTFIVEKN